MTEIATTHTTEQVAGLLEQQASFLRQVADQNAVSRAELLEARETYITCAKFIRTDPQRAAEDATILKVARDLLVSAAGFMRNVAEQNPELREDMGHNAETFERASRALKEPSQT